MAKITFEEVVGKNAKLMSILASRYNIRGYTRDDLYQEFLMVAWKCYNNFDPRKKTKFSTYLYRSMMLELYRLINKQPEHVLSLDDKYSQSKKSVDFLDLIMSDTEDPSEEEVRQEDFERVHEALMSLPRGHISIDKIMHGKSFTQIGSELGISGTRVGVIHRDNIQKARRLLGIEEEV